MKLRRVSTDDGPRIEALHDGQWVRLGDLHSLEELTRGHGAAGDATCPSAGMHYSLGAAIAQASKGEALHPGELFGSGTPPVGSGMENGHWLKPGDRLSLKIAEIGILTNTIARGTDR